MMDKEGGVRGGPEVVWFSTEHNLDAYAFFNLFYEVTNQRQYLAIAQKIKRWIANYAYTDYGPPIQRGKGDGTIATDTYAWSVTAFGPEVLSSLGMSPDAILEFAVNHCEVETTFERKEGKINLRGFDFAKFRNIARGYVVSGEWTAQMILAFEVMAEYYRLSDPPKSQEYINKAIFYFNELQKMIISSPSKAGREDPCLPYASKPQADTGHGWRTPKGHKTGSLASTAYFLIAYNGYNPFSSETLPTSLKTEYKTNSTNLSETTN